MWLYSRLQALKLLFHYVQQALWGSYKHKEVSYLLITVFTHERLGLLLYVGIFPPHFVLFCFYNYTNTYL